LEDYIIIIGAMKAGTTTLFSMLADHPEIAPAHPKEPGFFAFDDEYAKGFDWYHGLFDFDANTHRYRLEASTDYSKAPFVTGVWDRMKARPNARFKLIYIMRHPLKRIESHARHTERTRKEVGQIVSRRSSHSLDNGPSLPSLSMTRYATQLDAYSEARAAGDLYLTTLEDLKHAPERVMSELCEFLDIAAPDAVTEAPQQNKGGNRDVVRPVWSTLTSNKTVLNLAKAVMPESARQAIKAKFTTRTNVEGRFSLDTDEAQAILDLLEDDLARLRTEYNIDTARLWDLK